MNKNGVDIVVVNWNGGKYIERCVESLLAVKDNVSFSINIIVVDNSSKDGSVEWLRRAGSNIILVENTTNRGFAAACNQGASFGNCAYILFLNPDTQVSAAGLLVPIEFMDVESNSCYGACSVQLRDESGEIARSCARLPGFWRLLATTLGIAQILPRYGLGIPMSDWNHRDPRDVDHVIGAFLFVRRQVFYRVGCFDVDYFVYLEDLDLSLKIRQLGLRIRYLATVNVMHTGGGVSRQNRGMRLFYSLNSRYRYTMKNLGGCAAHILAIIMLTAEPLIRIIAAAVGRGEATPRAIVEAYRLYFEVRLRNLLGSK